MTTIEEFASKLRIREILKERGLKMTDLARMMGMSAQQVSNMTNGRSLSMRKLLEICDCLEVDIADLIRKPHEDDNNEYIMKRYIVCPHCEKRVWLEMKTSKGED